MYLEFCSLRQPPMQKSRKRKLQQEYKIKDGFSFQIPPRMSFLTKNNQASGISL